MIRVVSGDAVLVPVGGRWRIAVEADDDVTATVTKPDGTTAAATSTPGDPWIVEYVAADPGRHLAGLSTPNDTVLVACWAQGPTTAAGMPVVADAVKYLGGAEAVSWTDEDIGDALNAEAAAQRTVCRVSAIYPDDLREALMRRVARNLALRRLPLAVLTGDAEAGVGSSYVPGRDPEVRRLEGPYRKLVFG